MCLAVPAKVLEVDPARLRARVDYLGSQTVVGIALVGGVQTGQFVLVHVGEAVQVMDEEQARDGLALWREWLDDSEPAGLP